MAEDRPTGADGPDRGLDRSERRSHLIEQLEVPGPIAYELGIDDEEAALGTLGTIEEQLHETLAPDEPVAYVYPGVLGSFGGAGKGLYVLYATDRRFAVLDQEGNFTDLGYDDVISIDTEATTEVLAVDKPYLKWAALAVLGFFAGGILYTVTQINALGVVNLAALAVAGHFVRKHRGRQDVDLPCRRVVFRTPADDDISASAEVDLWLEELDLDVQREDRYVLYQWRGTAGNTGGNLGARLSQVMQRHP